MSDRTAQIDSTIRIVTPENIAFNHKLAGPFRRLPAFLLDLSFRIAATALIMLAISFSMPGDFQRGVAAVVFFLVSWSYGALFETYMNGQTPAKWILGLRVLTVDGQPINGAQAFARNLLRDADMMPPLLFMFPTCIVGLTAMAMNSRWQRLGDLVAGTMVVVEERKKLTEVVRQGDREILALAGLLPTNFTFSRSLTRALAMYVGRRGLVSSSRRRELAGKLANTLIRRFQLPERTDPDLLLCALYYRALVADPSRDERFVIEADRREKPRRSLATAAVGGGEIDSTGIEFLAERRREGR